MLSAHINKIGLKIFNVYRRWGRRYILRSVPKNDDWKAQHIWWEGKSIKPSIERAINNLPLLITEFNHEKLHMCKTYTT